MIQGLPEDVIGIFANETEGVKKRDFVTLWDKAFDKALAIRKTFKPCFSQMLAVKAFHEKMREEAVDGELFYGNSSAVRLGNIFSDQYIYVNRGVNGIEVRYLRLLAMPLLIRKKRMCTVSLVT